MKTYSKVLNRILCTIIATTMVLAGCRKPDDEKPDEPDMNVSILVDQSSFDLGAVEQQIEVVIYADTTWSVEGMNYWCRATPVSGSSGTTTLVIKVAANEGVDARSTTLSFASAATYSETITIRQSGFADLMVDRLHFDATAEGGGFTTTVYSTKPWQAASSADWCSVVPQSSADHDTSLRIEVAPYEGFTPRNAVIRFTGEFQNADSITVTQSGTMVFGLAKSQFSATTEASQIKVGVLSNTGYTVSCGLPWISCSPQRLEASADSTYFTVSVSANTGIVRRADIELRSLEGDSVRIVTVKQTGRTPSSAANITSFKFLRSKNAALTSDVTLTVAGDSVYGRVPVLNVDMSALVPTFVTSDRAQVFIGETQQVSGESRIDCRKRKTLTVVAEDGTERTYTLAAAHFTGLPILYVNTESAAEIASKDFWEGATYTLDGGLNFQDLPSTVISVKGRGNSSWGTFQKKRSYNMKFSERTEVLGMPKHKRWCLIGNYRDKTLLRNMVSMKLGSVTDLAWVPRGEQVELVLNGTHRGTYLLSEQIKIDKNRVNIAEMSIDDTAGDNITGGYVLEMDMYGDAETHTFESKYVTGTLHKGTPSKVHVKIPALADGNIQQFSYIEGYFRSAEEAVCNNGGNWSKAISTYVDLSSFADTWLIYEISATPEPARGPYSFYLYKNRGDTKFYGGPLWDFDFLSYIVGTQTSWVNTTAGWIPFLMECPEFKATVKSHWDRYKADFYKIQSDYINEQERYLKYSAEANWAMYDLAERGENGDEHIPSADAIQRMRTVLKTRLDWLDKQFSTWATVGADGTIAPVGSDSSDKDKNNFWK